MSGWKKYLGAALLGAMSLQAYAATLSTSASPNPATVGQTIELDVLLSDVVDLYTYQFSISFDPSVLQVTGVSLGNFLEAGGDTIGAPGTVDNVAGTVTYFYNTLYSPVPGVTGAGTLGHLTFSAVGAGTSALALSDVILLNSGVEDIGYTVAAGPITVSAVPEPATYLMFGAGLIGVAALRRRQLAKA
jgi:hypothetical protein